MTASVQVFDQRQAKQRLLRGAVQDVDADEAKEELPQHPIGHAVILSLYVASAGTETTRCPKR